MTFLSIIPIVLSIFALCISLYMGYLQYTYSKTEYEYKRDPVIGTPNGEFYLKQRPEGQGKSFMLKNINIEILEENNLERLYMISPNYEVTAMQGENYTEEIKEYFNDSFRSEEPDMEIGEFMYFYRFVLFEGLNDDLELNLFYWKYEKLYSDEVVQFSFRKIDHTNLLQIEKSDPNNPDYEGERKMAEQYKEIYEYYQKYV